MVAPRATVWELQPHTRAKHAILRRYLQAWIPILTQGGFPNILYIDGFAGPGRYAAGEDGSPIIAIRAALEHAAHIRGNILFLFVEERPDRAGVLRECLEDLVLPANFRIKVACGEQFAVAFEEVKRFYEKRGRHLPPTFAFIDPFGWAGVPFSVVQFILAQPSCEIFVTFMYEEINRFLSHPQQPENFDKFFGTQDWRGCLELLMPNDRNRFLHNLYLRQLREAGKAKYVRSFQMRNEAGLTDYYLFYATNNLLGLRKMKEAMWRVDEAGEFTFSDATDVNQLVLFDREPRYDLLANQLQDQFRGKEVALSQIEEFVLAETPFRETHYKRVLKIFESSDPPRLTLDATPKDRRKGTFPSPAMRVRFS
jgi:three-Cys-motif partner protein